MREESGMKEKNDGMKERLNEGMKEKNGQNEQHKISEIGVERRQDRFGHYATFDIVNSSLLLLSRRIPHKLYTEKRGAKRRFSSQFYQ